MAETDWSQPSSWSAGGMPAAGGGMWGAPQGGMQSPYGGGWSGGGYMQTPYGGAYGGFGGGMGYGGPYGMQSPYGAPGGYGGGYSPYGMPQQQSMMQASGMQAPQAAPQAAAVEEAGGSAAPQQETDGRGIFDITGNQSQTTTFKPWENLAQEYEKLFPEAQHEFFRQFGHTDKAGVFHPGQGPLGFDPSSEAGLARMEQLAGAGNPFYGSARDAVTGITSGDTRINTGGMWGGMFDDPGITGQGQYQDMANRDAIGNDQHYRDMIQQDAIGGGRFADLYDRPGVSTGGYNDLYGQNAVGTGRMEDIYGGPGVGTGNYQNILQGSGGQGSLAGGMFGRTASGEMVNANPYREKAIQDMVAQTSDQVKATMSSRGRYGSDAYGDAMGRALGQVATTARMQGYDTDTANMMAAAQGRSGEQLARQGIGLQAAGGIAGAQGQNIANRMGAAQSIMGAQQGNWGNRLAAMQGLTGAQSANVAQQMGAAQGLAGLQGTNAAQRLAQIQGLSGIQGQNYDARLGALGQMNQAQQMANQQRLAAAQGLTGVQGQNLQNRLQAAGMAPQMNQLRYDDATRMMQAGAARETMAQQQKDFGWQQMNQYRGILGNLPGAAGQQTQEANQPWWNTALGVAGALGGIWGGFGGGGA